MRKLSAVRAALAVLLAAVMLLAFSGHAALVSGKA
jgi:hypothetical protein